MYSSLLNIKIVKIIICNVNEQCKQTSSYTQQRLRVVPLSLKAETHDATIHSDMSPRQVAATDRLVWCVKIIVAVICRTNSNWFDMSPQFIASFVLAFSLSCMMRKKSGKKLPHEILGREARERRDYRQSLRVCTFHSWMIFWCRISYLDVLSLLPVVNSHRRSFE